MTLTIKKTLIPLTILMIFLFSITACSHYLNGKKPAKLSPSTIETDVKLKSSSDKKPYIVINWNTTNPFAHYEIYKAIKTDEKIELKKLLVINQAENIPVSDEDVEYGKTYVYQVRSLFADQSAYSKPIAVAVYNDAPEKENIKLYPVSKDVIKIIWNEVPGAKSYNIYRGYEDSSEPEKIDNTIKAESYVRNTTSSSPCYFKVQACFEFYDGKISEKIYFEHPQNFESLSTTTTSAYIKWDIIEYASSYRIYLQYGNEEPQILSTNDPFENLVGLIPDSSYTVSCHALYADKFESFSPDSNEITFRTKA